MLFVERPHLIPDRDRGIRLILRTVDPEESSPEEPSRQAVTDVAEVQRAQNPHCLQDSRASSTACWPVLS